MEDRTTEQIALDSKSYFKKLANEQSKVIEENLTQNKATILRISNEEVFKELSNRYQIRPKEFDRPGNYFITRVEYESPTNISDFELNKLLEKGTYLL